MIIGNFTYDGAKDSYAGDIQTLTLLRNKVTFRPVTGKSDKGPDYRVVVEGRAATVELGAAWKRTSEAGREFLSVTLDDPTLDRPLSVALMPSEKGDSAILVWSRSNGRETPSK